MSLRRKEERERRIFCLFAKAVPYGIRPASIRSGKGDRAPDIFCRLSTGERVAFELGEILDKGLARDFHNAMALKMALDGAFAGREAPFKQAFGQMFLNAAIAIFFRTDVPLKRRQEAVHSILDYLITLGPNTEGEFFPRQRALREVVKVVTIFRGAFRGPVFDTPAGGAIGNPVRTVLEDKFEKTYATDLPIELVAYYDLQPEPPGSIWEPEISRFVPVGLQSSPFRRVWVFSCTSGQVLYVHPPLS